MEIGAAKFAVVSIRHLVICEEADAVTVLPDEAVVALYEEAIVFVVVVGDEFDIAADTSSSLLWLLVRVRVRVRILVVLL